MTIISIRGPSGSGKSTVVTRLMEKHGPSTKLFAADHKLPIGLLFETFVVAGRYDVMASGVDAVPLRNWNRDQVFDQLARWALNYHVVFEGMAISNDTKRTPQLPGIVVIGLTTPLADCVRDSTKRREGSAVKNADNTQSIQKRIKELDSAYDRLEQAGVRVERLDREQAYQRVLACLAI